MKLSFSEKNIVKNVLKIFSIILFFLIIEYFALQKSIQDIRSGLWFDKNTIIAALLFFSGYVFASIWYRIRYRVDNFLDDAIGRLKSAYKGYLGEKNTFDKLSAILGSDYKIYPNFVIPGTKFDNDFIIVGPKGIVSIEVKNISGKYDFIGEETYRHNLHYGNECLCKLSEYQSPSREIIRHCAALENWLGQQGFENFKPKGLILLAGDNSLVNKIEPTNYYVIKNLEELTGTLEKTKIDPRFNSELLQGITNLFNKFN